MAANPFRRAVLLLAGAALPFATLAQTLARPGWAGSGLNGEPWWRSAVFYRVDPRTFQDSDGDGVGDLPGLTSRLDYLQTLGVDALLLVDGSATRRKSPALPFAVLDDPGFDELVSEASRRHLRVVLAQARGQDQSTLLARSRLALTRGAAGLEITGAVTGTTASPGAISSLSATLAAPSPLGDLRTLAASFPGERIILSDVVDSSSASGNRATRRAGALALHSAEAPELVSFSLNQQPTSAGEISASERSLVSNADVLPPGVSPLFRAGVSQTGSLSASLATVLAVRLLSLRGALVLDAGQELGLPSTVSDVSRGTGTQPAAGPMQWTPRNVTPPAVKIEPNPEPTPVPTRSDVYGAYRPYVPVKPKPVVLPGAPAPPPEPDSLPGFTSGHLPSNAASASDLAHRNVAVEDLDPRSLLNLYRRLIALHHGHATLRIGSTAVLDAPAGGAAVWVRRAPAGARTVASVIVACNLSDAPLSLSLDLELTQAHIRPGLLRPLLGTFETPSGPQSTAHLSLAAHSVYVGEIYHH